MLVVSTDVVGDRVEENGDEEFSRIALHVKRHQEADECGFGKSETFDKMSGIDDTVTLEKKGFPVVGALPAIRRRYRPRDRCL